MKLEKMDRIKNVNGVYNLFKEIRPILHCKPVILFLIKDVKTNNTINNKKPPHQLYHFSVTDSFKREEPIIIGFYKGRFGCLDGSLELSNFSRKPFMETPLSSQIATYLIQEWNSPRKDGPIENESMIIGLGNYLLKLLCQHESRHISEKIGISHFQLKIIYRYIKDNIDRTITNQKLANIVGLSPYHFIRMFKRTTGETPHQCITRLKLDHARNLLLDNQDSIIQVSLGVGIDNPSYFSQQFKNCFGMSPLKYRKAYRNYSLTG